MKTASEFWSLIEVPRFSHCDWLGDWRVPTESEGKQGGAKAHLEAHGSKGAPSLRWSRSVLPRPENHAFPMNLCNPWIRKSPCELMSPGLGSQAHSSADSWCLLGWVTTQAGTETGGFAYSGSRNSGEAGDPSTPMGWGWSQVAKQPCSAGPTPTEPHKLKPTDLEFLSANAAGWRLPKKTEFGDREGQLPSLRIQSVIFPCCHCPQDWVVWWRNSPQRSIAAMRVHGKTSWSGTLTHFFSLGRACLQDSQHGQPGGYGQNSDFSERSSWEERWPRYHESAVLVFYACQLWRVRAAQTSGITPCTAHLLCKGARRLLI